MKTPLIVTLIALLMLAGCETVSSKPTPMSGEDGITAADVIDAALAPDAEKRSEALFDNSTGKPVLYATGAIWARVFVGQGLSGATLELMSTRLSEKVAADGTHRVTYDVVARLTVDTKSYPLHATATRPSTPSDQSAMRQAVEAAAVDVAKQAKVIIKKVHPDFVPE